MNEQGEIFSETRAIDPSYPIGEARLKTALDIVEMYVSQHWLQFHEPYKLREIMSRFHGRFRRANADPMLSIMSCPEIKCVQPLEGAVIIYPRKVWESYSLAERDHITHHGSLLGFKKTPAIPLA